MSLVNAQWPALSAVLLLSACATPTERVVLLPNADGHASAVVVESKSGTSVVDQAWGEAWMQGDGELKLSSGVAAEIEADFSDVLAARPPRPEHFLLYFQFDSEQLTPESERAVEAMLSAIAARPAPEVLIVGHTDSRGEVPYNDELSLRRAEVVRERLQERIEAAGIAPARIGVAGRGEREPLVPTGDDSDEARNRRVEIAVR